MASRETALVLIAGIACGWAGGPSTAANAATAGTINACVGPTGQVRILSPGDSCKTNETPLSWNIQGPQGPKGDTGSQGPAGPPGAPGLSGLENDENDALLYPRAVSSVLLQCPAGKSIISAGYDFLPSTTADVDLGVLGSFPFVYVGSLDWIVAISNKTSDYYPVHVFANCAQLPPDAFAAGTSLAVTGKAATRLTPARGPRATKMILVKLHRSSEAP